MARSKPYNGWKNWQTWNVALWLGNDEGLYRAWRERVATRITCGKCITAQWARCVVRDLLPEGTPDMKPLPGRKYAGVDFRAIAEMMAEV